MSKLLTAVRPSRDSRVDWAWLYDKEYTYCGKLIDHIDALQGDSELEYRHECLKMMYSDEMNYLDDDLSVDLAIDGFISEEQSHS